MWISSKPDNKLTKPTQILKVEAFGGVHISINKKVIATQIFICYEKKVQYSNCS